MNISISSAPEMGLHETDDSSPIKIVRKMSDGGLRKESVEEVVTGTIIGLSRLDYRTVHTALRRLIHGHNELYNLVHDMHDTKKCSCKTTKTYQKIMEELGTERPKIVYCFLTSLIKLRLQGSDFTSRKIILDGDLSFLKSYSDTIPKRYR